MAAPLFESRVPGVPCRRGKVRDVYDLGDRLVLVATDRISAFDHVLPTPIPDKGRILTSLTGFWLDHLGVAYKGLNVLESNDLRDGIKTYSNWPTIPQLYVKGEFVGGCDIVREMFQAGELQSLLKDKGVAGRAPAA